MANTTERLASLIEQLSSLKQGAGNVYLVVPEDSTTAAWRQIPAFAKGVDGVIGASQIYPTIAQALAQCVSGRGDTVLVAPGFYVQTTQITLSKNGVTLRGLGAKPFDTIIRGPTTAGTHGLLVDASDCSIENLTLQGQNATGWGCKNASRSNNRWLNCFFGNEGAAPTQVGGLLLDASGASGRTYPKVIGCRFANAVIGLRFTSGNGASLVNSGATVQDCEFSTNSTADIQSTGTTASDDVLIKDCDFAVCSTNLVIAITSPALKGLVTGCRFAVAANTQANLTGGAALDAATEYAGNYTRAGLSTAKPA